MFDLEANVAAWKQALASRGSVQPEALDELEDHLRASFERLSSDAGVQNALTPEERFALAARRMGDPQALSAEFERADPSAAARRRWIWMLTGYVGIHLASQTLLTVSVIVASTTWYADPLLSSALFALSMLGGVALMIFAARAGVVRRALDSVTSAAGRGAWSSARTVAVGVGALLASMLLTPLGTIVSARSMSVGRLWNDPPIFVSTFYFGLQQSARVIAFAAPFVILTVLLLRERARRATA
jgi:hypothetical protein